MKNSHKVAASLAGLTLLVLLVVTLSFRSFKQIETAAEARKHTSAILISANELLSALRDAETSQRGYLLTGNEAFLQPYVAAQNSIVPHLVNLQTLTIIPESRKILDAMMPLVDAKLAEMARVIDVRRKGNVTAATQLVVGGEGKRLMNSIRTEMSSFIQKEESARTQYDAKFQSMMRRMFATIAIASLLLLLFALVLAYFIYRQGQQQLKNIVHLETEHRLNLQEESNKQLQTINVALSESDAKSKKLLHELEIVQLEVEVQNTELQRSQHELETQQLELEMQNDELRLERESANKLEKVLRESEEHLAVTLNSIGDAVIVTDYEARITRLNPIAEQLTGWTQAEAAGRPVDEIFNIVNKDSRQPAPIPVLDAIAQGTIQGLANHTVLIARNGLEYDIADSCAPIRNCDAQVVGAVLVFRDVTEEYAVQQSLRDGAALMRAILNTVVDGIITIHASGGVIETVNPAAELMFGYSAAELDGQNFSLLIPELDQDQRNGSLEYYSASEEALASGHGREVIGKRKDGSFFPLELAASEMHLGGQRYFTGILRDTTARKQAEEALLKAGALQSAIFNSANFSSIATDAKGVIQIFNVGAERMLGYTAAEVMNKISPADISDPQEVIARAAALSIELETPITPGFEALVFKASRGIEDIYELTYIRKDGSRFPAVVSVTALRDDQDAIIGYLLIGTDNTARKQAEEALLKAGALQSAIFNSANFSSIATDANGVIQIFNVGAERMLGYAAAEVMDKITPADISDPQEIITRAEALSVELGTPITPGFEALVFKALRGIEDIYELTYIRKDGSRFPAVVSVTALRDAQGSILGYLLIGTDNTARKQIEAERVRLEQVLQDKNTELESAKSIAENANRAKSDFLSSMSHELRTPLSAILGFAQLMESGSPQPTATQQRSIEQILKAGWYLLELINEILDLAVIESGKLSMSLEPVSLTEIMHECESLVEQQAKKQGIRVTFVHFETPCFVRADQTRVKQVLINLLSNAIKYNKTGGTVVVDCVQRDNGVIRINVRDSGEGLSPEQLTQLFQPFNRLGQEASTEQGTGIGLVVSKRLVEWMGGVIGVESTVGSGSVFWFELDLTTESQAAAIIGKPSTVVLPHVKGDEPLHTILYVEDNPANLMLVEDIIARRPDIRLLSAQDGKSGIELARASLPDVILMDIHLPGISGIDAMKILVADPATAHIPVVALSANAIPRDIEKGLEAGFFRYLTKPIKVNEFMNTLDMALEFAKTRT
jgi:PAS domain S-box-containing protein